MVSVNTEPARCVDAWSVLLWNIQRWALLLPFVGILDNIMPVLLILVRIKCNDCFGNTFTTPIAVIHACMKYQPGVAST